MQRVLAEQPDDKDDAESWPTTPRTDPGAGIARGRIRVSAEGFRVLDAVVADLAA